MIAIHASHLAAAGHQVTIKTNHVNTVFSLDPNVRIVPMHFSGKAGTLLSALFERSEADFIIADIIPLAFLLCLFNPRRTIYFAQDYDESYYSNCFKKLFVRFLYLLSLTLIRIRSIAVSQPLAELLRSQFGAQVTVVENGVDASQFYPDPDPGLLAIKMERKALLLFSRSDYRKGFDIAVQAVERLQSKQTIPCEIWTVGEPAPGLFPNWIHRDFGYVGEERLRQIMSSADIFLYPTRHEGFGLMPLEAMACGCVVVTTTAIPYAVHGDNAFVAQIEDSEALTGYITDLLDDENMRRQLIDSGAKLATKHKLSDATQQFEMALVGMLKI